MKPTKDQLTIAKKADIKRVLNKYNDRKERDEALKEELAMCDFIASVKNELVKKHMTKYALAKKIGLNPFVVSRVLDNAENAQYKTLQKMAHGLGKRLEMKLT
jgi:ribosome-binding protein aMBF1 (putative translation factor)